MDGVILCGWLWLRIGVAGVARGFGKGRNGLRCLGFRWVSCCQRQGAEQGQGRQETRSVSLHDVLGRAVRGGNPEECEVDDFNVYDVKPRKST